MSSSKAAFCLFYFSPIPPIASCLIMIIIYKYSSDKVEIVWMSSKLKSVKNIISKKKSFMSFT